MANYQNGQPYYPPYNQPPQPSQNQFNTYGSQPGYPEADIHRAGSFNAGDDTAFFEQGQDQPRGGTGNAPYGSSTAASHQSPHMQQTHQLPLRGSSIQPPMVGYQHQNQTAPTAPGHSTYNPSQYSQTQVQMQMQMPSSYQHHSYGSPPTSQTSNAYQPYIPAAYHGSNLQSHSSQPMGVYSPQSAQPTSPALPPLPRLSDPYSRQSAYYGGYQHESQYPNYNLRSPSATTFSPQQLASSPPAPAPPLHDSYVTPRPYSHSATSAQYHHSTSQSPPVGQYGLAGAESFSSGVERNPSFVSRISNNSNSYVPSPEPSLPSPPSQNASQVSPPPNNPVDRHPQSRPLPGPPSESESENDYFGPANGSRDQNATGQRTSGYDDLMQALDEGISRVGYGHQSSASGDGNALFRQPSTQQPLVLPDEIPTHMNGIVGSGSQNINYGGLTDDSDAEAAAGLAAMQAAEEQEAAEEARRRSVSASLFGGQDSQRHSRAQPSALQDVSSDSDYANVDMGLVGGGYEGHMHYGESAQFDYATATGESFDRLNPRMASVRSSGVSSEGRESHTSYDSVPPYDAIHPFPPFRTDVARVDTGGTGGLTEPSYHARRLSFDDGDESHLMENEYGQRSSSVSPTKDSMPDLFYHPGMSPNRPLPPPPSSSDPTFRHSLQTPTGGYSYSSRYSQYDNVDRGYPAAADSYQNELLSPTFPRSTSLSSNRSAPKPDQPIRSKTDADRAKYLRQQMAGRPMSDAYDAAVVQDGVPLDLPALPRKRFNPSKLSIEQYKKCSEPWALTSLLAWIKDLAEEETDLKEQAIVDGIVALFIHKVPTMNTADAETLGDRVVKQMLQAGALVKEEEWVKFGSGSMGGVLFQLTGTGCYSSKLHLFHTKGRCYSHHCMRTLKKVDLSLPTEGVKKTEDWATFYKLTKEDIVDQPKKEVERQNNLHEIVMSEDLYISNLDLVRALYRDPLVNAQPPIIPEKGLAKFVKLVFGQIDRVKKVNEDFLLAQLKYRQNEQGPWIVGFSDIFREWIRRARAIYVEFAAGFPQANYLMRRESSRNFQFKNFLDHARTQERSKKLGWDSYLKEPITRLQRYSLLLQTVHNNMPKDSEEKTNLQFAIDEVRAATFECNAKLSEMEKTLALQELVDKIKLRPNIEKQVELNLDHLGREIIFRGDLQRPGSKGVSWVDTHAILFDHYLVLAKHSYIRDSAGKPRYEKYDVSKVPIPMDLIILESTNDDAVVKSSVKISGFTTVAPRGQLNLDPRLSRTTSTMSGGPGTLTHTNTSTSTGSRETAQSARGIVPTTVLEGSGGDDQKVMYPFRIKHLGKTEVYTLFAPSLQNRQDWCEAIIEAKTRHAASLFAQNAEPFKLRVLADTAFAYDGLTASARRVNIRGTPLDRAIKEAEKKYEGQSRPTPVCRATVNCATVFNQPYGRLMCAIGTDYGVYISEYENPRGWIRAIQMMRVTQIAVFEEFNLFLLIADKSLIAYHLDMVCPTSGSAGPQSNDATSRRAPQKLSGTKDVGFFATGKMKDRALVFYKKRDGASSTFKVLEPVLQKSTASRSRFLPSSTRRGQTEFFRDYDEFYIPTDCYSINLFQTSLAVMTARGVEVLTLDKKVPWTIPNLRSEEPQTQAHLNSIANRIKDLKPLGMFRLGEAEFLLAFSECAVYVNKHGDVSRGVVMEFVGRAKCACLYGQYLILFDDDFVEIRNAMNGRMKQVIAGKDVKMLDDGGGGTGGAHPQSSGGLGGGLNGLGLQGYGSAPRTVKICMQHPEHEKSHVVVELVENESLRE